METIDKASNSAHEVVDKIAGASNQTVEALGEKTEQLKNAEQQMMNDCRSYIQNNPATSMGIAVAAGFLLSRLLSGR
ncbi:MAG: DUF883 family protein [Methylobacter tundripaludum]|uniref:ElaB/YqjD/DUF883 family membrane-anchored ribosome-binding protein n=1 Tax=Methylobacter tundripaludum TaxID=173365 RepID=A0A2S6H3T3_9GAMM|nr:DUF883 family protein [Methylobacter tundripaludum]MCK9635389.1 DUF883 family protein [Methylobacter tundripaludum]PPK72080.1 ElaB/YqjD/DUF883 family membrane-anchored ribosome-binding protein [Methylobacter tundripaludum]